MRLVEARWKRPNDKRFCSFIKVTRSRSFRIFLKGKSTNFRFLPGWWYIFVTGYDSKTHLTASSMMGELSWRMSGIACWLAIHALAGRIKFVLIFNLKDCPKTMRKWYGNMFEVETSSKVVTFFSIIHVNQSVHSYIPMSLLQCLSFGLLHTIFPYQNRFVSKSIRCKDESPGTFASFCWCQATPW